MTTTIKTRLKALEKALTPDDEITIVVTWPDPDNPGHDLYRAADGEIREYIPKPGTILVKTLIGVRMDEI